MPSRLWHPFADMSAVRDREVVFTRGEGAWLEDEAGRRYLDATASLWYCNVGHGRAEIAEAAAAQMRELAGYHTFGDHANRPALELAERIAAIAPMPEAVVFFTTGGSDAVDTAAKLARRYWHAVGRPEKQVIVHRTSAYHGMNAYGTALAGIPANRADYGTLIEATAVVPRDSTEALRELFEREADRIAAFIGEPVIGAGGVYRPTDGYWAEVERLCREHDVLLIVDEVISGFGRLGTWFGSERIGVVPDMITCAKGITSGYVPLGAVVVGERVKEPFWTKPAGGGAAQMFRHGYTYSGHPTSCAAALANLDIIEREGLVARVAQMEPVLWEGARRLEGHPAVGEVRGGLGLLAAIEFAPHVLAADAGFAGAAAAAARQAGVVTRLLVGHSLQVSPPFVLTEAESDRLFDGLRDGIDAAVAARGMVAAAW